MKCHLKLRLLSLELTSSFTKLSHFLASNSFKSKFIMIVNQLCHPRNKQLKCISPNEANSIVLLTNYSENRPGMYIFGKSARLVYSENRPGLYIFGKSARLVYSENRPGLNIFEKSARLVYIRKIGQACIYSENRPGYVSSACRVNILYIVIKANFSRNYF